MNDKIYLKTLCELSDNDKILSLLNNFDHEIIDNYIKIKYSKLFYLNKLIILII